MSLGVSLRAQGTVGILLLFGLILEIVEKPVVSVRALLAATKLDVPLDGAADANAHEPQIKECGASIDFF